MIGYNRQYKGIDFTDSVQYQSKVDNGYAIFLQNENHDNTTSMDSFERANYHGGYSSEVLISPRIFSFSGKIVGHTKTLRHEARNTLISAIQPEHNPGAFGRGFYDLTFKDDGGNDRLAYAKVQDMPTNTNGLDDPIIEFNFTLYSETEKIYGTTLKVSSGSIGTVGGNTFPTTFPTTFSGYAGTITCTNNGNRATPIYVSVVGSVTNPKIINTTNRQKYRITKTTNNLIFDNRNISNDPKRRLVVTDQGDNIKAYRDSGAGIYLDPGENKLVVLGDSFDADVIVTVYYRDTFIY